MSKCLDGAIDCGAIATGRLDELFEWPEATRRLARVLQGESEQNFTARLRGEEAAGAKVAVRMRLLAGAEPLALVEFHQKPADCQPGRMDPLTRLSDRDAIAHRIEQWRIEAAPHEARFAVLFLDLDGFKDVNDEHGHTVGDRVLQEVAARWARCLREGDLVARYGGDEFVALVKDASTKDEIDPVIRRLRQAAMEPIAVDGLPLQVTVTIGMAVASSNEATVDALVAAADRDMYSQKRAARP
jgi:diguanylate cyclase (GGDEF)-like protein